MYTWGVCDEYYQARCFNAEKIVEDAELIAHDSQCVQYISAQILYMYISGQGTKNEWTCIW